MGNLISVNSWGNFVFPDLMNTFFNSLNLKTIPPNSNGGIINMNSTFYGCSSLKVSFADWDISSTTDFTNFFALCDINETGTTDNYDSTLISWSQQNVQPNVKNVDFGTSKYSQLGKIGRDILEAKGWTFVDGGYQYKFPHIPIEDYVLATDADFSGTEDGTFKYIGTDEYVIIPNVIKGVTVTNTEYMFMSTINVKGVASLEDNSITNMGYMFFSSQSPTLDLSYLNTNKVNTMLGMFNSCKATALSLLSFNTRNVTQMTTMFEGS